MFKKESKNIVYIATSIDGYIADKEGSLDWLECIPNPDGSDFGFAEFIETIDAIIMGRSTYETVIGFDISWPYTKPVFVLSHTIKNIPDNLKGKAELVKGPVKEVLRKINNMGYNEIYIDGGKVIQGFLKDDLIDEMIITQIPILLGGGTPLFGLHDGQLKFEHVNTELMLNTMVKSHFRRIR